MSVVSLSMEGAQGIAASLNSLSSSVEQLAARQAANTRATQAGARANASASSSMQTMAQTAQQGAQRLQGVASAVQSLVTMMGSENDSAGMVARVAGATAQFAGMGAMLGPGGAVIGGILGMAAGLRSIAAAADEAAAAVTRMNSDAAAVTTRLGSALGDPSSLTEDDVARLMSEGAEARRSLMERESSLTETIGSLLADPGDRMAAAADRDRVRDQIRVLSERIDALNSLDPSALAREAPTESGRVGIDVGTGGGGPGGAAIGGGRGSGGGRGARDAPAFLGAAMTEDALASLTSLTSDEELARRAEVDAERAASLRAEDQADFEHWADVRRESQERAADASREWAEHERALLAESQEALTAFSTGYETSVTRIVDAWNRANTAARAAGQQQMTTAALMGRSMTAVGNQITDTVGNKMVGAFEEAVGAWLDGSKSFVEAAEAMAKGVIKSLTQEAIVQTVVELARGIASFASQDYAGGVAHLGAAAAWAAVGVVAGGIGAATGAFGGGGGGKEGGASQRDMADSDRERQRDTAPGTTVVNLYMTGMPMTQSDVGAGFYRGIRASQRAGYLPAGALTGGR
jgi:hypothetical protein